MKGVFKSGLLTTVASDTVTSVGSTSFGIRIELYVERSLDPSFPNTSCAFWRTWVTMSMTRGIRSKKCVVGNESSVETSSAGINWLLALLVKKSVSSYSFKDRIFFKQTKFPIKNSQFHNTLDKSVWLEFPSSNPIKSASSCFSCWWSEATSISGIMWDKLLGSIKWFHCDGSFSWKDEFGKLINTSLPFDLINSFFKLCGIAFDTSFGSSSSSAPATCLKISLVQWGAISSMASNPIIST